MKKVYVLKNKRRFTLLVVISIFLLYAGVFTSKAYGYKELEYKTITVKKGDTLWAIAGRNHSGGDIRKYIYDIQKANNMTTSEIFHGDKLILPVSRK